MWTSKAFHVREIPSNNVIHVTDSLAVHQTRQNIPFETVKHHSNMEQTSVTWLVIIRSLAIRL